MLNWLRSLFLPVIPKDGDTINFKGVTVRLRGIDAPELAQPGGKEAKAFLHSLIKQAGRLSVKITGQDRYGRKLGVLIGQGDVDMNELMVREGYAHAYMSTLYADEEAYAKKRKRGWLGKAKRVVMPSVWRKRK